MTTATDDGDRLAVGFARALRGAGIPTGPDSSTRFAAALAEVGVERRERVYWAGRATLVPAVEHIPIYDAVFDTYFTGAAAAAGPPPSTTTIGIAVDDPDASEAPDDASSPTAPPPDLTLTVRWSPVEVLRTKDFAAYTPAELREAHELMADLRLVGARRRSRRRRPVRSRHGGALDVRRTVRRSLRAGGEPVRLERSGPSERPRRVVLLVDVSGSMEPYARALVRFVQAAVAGRTRVEAFTIATRLTRITRELTSRDPDEALTRATRAVADWSGGTRLGEAMQAFNDRWGVRGMARGAVVVILSDGWDRGDPELLGNELERLHRVAHRVVWVNPLKATPGYAPLAAGMAAALPHVDELVTGHNLESLETLVEVIRA